MKRLRKIKGILTDNSGETIVEVVVAFALLSVMLVIFSQGLAWATTSEQRARQNRKDADDSMIRLQEVLAGGSSDGVICVADTNPVVLGSRNVYRYTYTINGNTYIIYKTDDPSGSSGG